MINSRKNGGVTIEKNVVNTEKIKELMKEKDLNYALIAKKTGYTAPGISYILRNKIKNPSVEVLSKIANLLDVKLSDIIIIDKGDDSKC